MRNQSEIFHRRRPTSPTWPDANAHSRALKTDPKHTTRQWSIIISSRPPPCTRENAGRCAAHSFLLGAIKSGLFDSRKSRDKIETRTPCLGHRRINLSFGSSGVYCGRADCEPINLGKRVPPLLQTAKECRRMQFGVINRIWSCAKGPRRQDAMSLYRSRNELDETNQRRPHRVSWTC